MGHFWSVYVHAGSHRREKNGLTRGCTVKQFAGLDRASSAEMLGSQMDTPNGNSFVDPTKACSSGTRTGVIFPVLFIEPSPPRANALQQAAPIKGAARGPPTFYQQQREKVLVGTTGLAHRPFSTYRTLGIILFITTTVTNLSLWTSEKCGHLITKLFRQ